VAVFRWVALVWMVTVVWVLRHDLARPWLAWALVGLAAVVTVAWTVLLESNPQGLLRPAPVVAELVCGVLIVVADGFAYEPGHVFGPSQTLGVIWPLSGVLAAGVILGPWAGAAAGAVIGLARFLDALANGVREFTDRQVLSIASSVVVFGLAGATVGYIVVLLRGAREEVAEARAREEVARTLHDGVLQTLAHIQRRSTENGIMTLAHEQERELRDYLFRTRPSPLAPGAADLALRLRGAVARFEDAFEASAEVLVADDLPPLSVTQVDALAGAAGEALTNAGKHGRARRAVVYVEPDDDGGVFCSVKDDGVGFDPAVVPEGVGLTRSVRARVADVGGRVEVRSAPGDGTEVCLWVP
jgi:signal transduction histidine kinase